MNTKQTLIILLLSFLISTSSCIKKADTIDLHLNETVCNNPWSVNNAGAQGIDNNDPDYQNKVKDFLVRQNIEIKAISITNDGPASGCFTCFCATGRRINITANSTDQANAMSLGFYHQ